MSSPVGDTLVDVAHNDPAPDGRAVSSVALPTGGEASRPARREGMAHSS